MSAINHLPLTVLSRRVLATLLKGMQADLRQSRLLQSLPTNGQVDDAFRAGVKYVMEWFASAAGLTSTLV